MHGESYLTLAKIYELFYWSWACGAQVHPERYEHRKDRGLMGLMCSPESDGHGTRRLTVKIQHLIASLNKVILSSPSLPPLQSSTLAPALLHATDKYE